MEGTIRWAPARPALVWKLTNGQLASAAVEQPPLMAAGITRCAVTMPSAVCTRSSWDRRARAASRSRSRPSAWLRSQASEGGGPGIREDSEDCAVEPAEGKREGFLGVTGELEPEAEGEVGEALTP